MKKKFTCIFLYLLIICLSAKPGNAYADCAGGELVYQWLRDSTYRVFFKYYDDCSGSTVPATQTLCIINTCDATQNTSTNMQLWGGAIDNGLPNGSALVHACPGLPTKCQSPSSTLADYREWWYTADITLRSRCSAWKFAVTIGARATANNIGNGGFYIEAVINNQQFQGNSSPFFSVRPVPDICLGKPYSYNSAAIDSNGDSLVIEVVRAQTAVSCAAAPGNIAFNVASPPYGLPGNPLQTGNTFSINGEHGRMTYTPTLAGPSAITTRVREYRDGVLIGHVMRDIQVHVLNGCSNTVPEIKVNNITGGVTSGIYLYTCQESSFYFCFDVISSDPSAVLTVTSNQSSAIPAAHINYLNQNTDSVRGCFTWLTNLKDSGLRTLVINVRDASCKPPGIQYYHTFTIPVFVWGKTRAQKYSEICPGDSVMLRAKNGLNFQWTALPGGSGTASLSCTSCANPFARPAVTTTYEVKSAHTYCPKVTDTVTVRILDAPVFTPVNDTIACPGTTVQLDLHPAPPAGASYTYLWQPAANLSLNTISNPVASVNKDIIYSVVITAGNGCKAYDTVFIDALDGFTLANNADTAICLGDSVKISGVGDSRYTFTWSSPSPSYNITNPGQLDPVIIPLTTGRYAYIIRASYQGCADSTDSVNIEVQPYPGIEVPETIRLCLGDLVKVNAKITPEGYPFTYLWTPPGLVSNPNIPGPDFHGGTAGNFTAWLIATSTAGCADTAQVKFIVSTPSAFITYLSDDTTICAPDSIQLHVEGEGLKRVNWHPGITMSDTASFDPYVFPGATTTYYVTGLDSNGCRDSLGVVVQVKSAAMLHLPDSVLVYPGESVRMDPQGNCIYYTWTPSLYLSEGGVPAPLITPEQSITYVVNGATEYGCKVSDTIDVILLKNSFLEMPNTFTPAGSKVNPVIAPVYRGRIILKRFAVYNRWGNKVFETRDINEGWDGRYNGELQPMGVYVYDIEGTLDKETAFRKHGNITLIR